jgi:transposase
MEEKLTIEETAALIRARKILTAKGLPRDMDVTAICEKAGVSRKTGYQWADKLATKPTTEEERLREELKELQAEKEELARQYEDVRFENAGRKLAWEIHEVDKLLAAQKKDITTPGKRRKP